MSGKNKYKIIPLRLSPEVLAVLDELVRRNSSNRTREAARSILEEGERAGIYLPVSGTPTEGATLDSAQPP